MDIFNYLVLIKNNVTNKFEDKTSQIRCLKEVGNLVEVTYINSNITYKYSFLKVKKFQEPKKVNLERKIFLIDGFPMKKFSLVLNFGEYIKIIDENQLVKIYHKSRITCLKSCLDLKKPRVIFNYFKKLSYHMNLVENGRSMLFEQYENINSIREDSVLATYLSGSEINKNNNSDLHILPFGLNLSQKKAVKEALENSISIIEGPPGTGKTQTILNIIANVVIKGKTVAVVSGNNSAISNVEEKMINNGYGFMTALLGNYNNKTKFFKNIQYEIPDLTEWVVETKEMKNLTERLGDISRDLDNLLEERNGLAKLREKLSKLKIEQNYFEKNFKDTYISTLKFSFYKEWSGKLIIDFVTYYETFVVKHKNRRFLIEILLFFKYGIYKFKFFNENEKTIINSLKRDYYKISIKQIQNQISFLERKLKAEKYNTLIKEYTSVSERLFKGMLYKKYSSMIRGKYTAKTFKYKFKQFIEDYPVILSTTHSIINSISENYLFDYLIIDEASQVDLITASLALACCKNVVIVGDVKQLSQIVKHDIEQISDKLFYASNIKEAYNYTKCNIIVSLKKLYGTNLPNTLLNEHYRCHPKIIGFCNEKFYDDNLVIMREEKPDDRPLKIYKTVPGNHARKYNIHNKKSWFNIRQIEVIRDEIIGANKEKYGDCSKVGIISPYRKQVTEINKYIHNPAMEVDTIHKFQGREKNTIIFTMVVNDINPFVDDANLINVAVSRAVNELILVTSHKLFKQHGTNIGDLIRYMEYNSYKEDVIQSQKVSVFDLLYSDYSDKLLKIMHSNKYVSEYKSENLMYSIIYEVLSYDKFKSFKCVLHVPLSSIVRDFSILNEEEKIFAENPWTHVDFLIFNKLDKEPVLVVEVDGYEYHMNRKKQQYRDVLKDRVLKKIKLSIIRITTNESGEKEKLIDMLNKVIKESGGINENINIVK